MFLHISTTGNLTLNEPNLFLCHFLRKKDSKSRTKVNSSPGLIRAYGRRAYVTSKFQPLDGFTTRIAMDAPPAGAFGALGSSAIIFYASSSNTVPISRTVKKVIIFCDGTLHWQMYLSTTTDSS